MRPSIQRSPDVLVLQLNRFSHDNISGASHKVHTRISLDESLLFGNTRYMLRAFVSHSGSTMMNGHYTCVERCGDQWIEYSDARVTPLRGDLAAHDGHATGAYILFYEMQQPLPPPTQLQPTAAAPAAARGAQPQL